MKKKLFCFICIVWLGFSCGSYSSLMRADARIKNVQIGMSMNEVAKVMGDHYEVVKANQYITVWGYKTYENHVYEMVFENERLSEFTKVRMPKLVEVHNEKE